MQLLAQKPIEAPVVEDDQTTDEVSESGEESEQE